MEIIPLNFGLRYRPPKLGLEYHIRDQPNAHFVHEISLSFVTKYSDIDEATDEVFVRNSEFLNPRVIAHAQVRRLVERLIKALGTIDKERTPVRQSPQVLATEAPAAAQSSSEKKPASVTDQTPVGH
jgi:hypothetical protein